MGGGLDGKIHISDGNPNVLSSNRNDDGQWLNAYWDYPDNEWNDEGLYPNRHIRSGFPWLGAFSRSSGIADGNQAENVQEDE